MIFALFVELAGGYETEPRIERSGTAFRVGNVAGQQLLAARRTNEICDQPHGLAPVSVMLVTFVDQQLPKEPGTDDLGRIRDAIPAQHDEPDRLVVGVDRPVPRVRLRVFLGVFERSRDRADEALLARRNAQREHLVAIRIGQFAKVHPFVAHAPMMPRAVDRVESARVPRLGAIGRSQLRCLAEVIGRSHDAELIAFRIGEHDKIEIVAATVLLDDRSLSHASHVAQPVGGAASA